MKTILFSILLFLSGSVLISAEADSTLKKSITTISIGNNTITLTAYGDSTNDDSMKFEKRYPRRLNKFAGIDLGVHGWFSGDHKMNLPEELNAFDLDYAKSISIGINVFEKYIPIAHERFGITTGLGLQLNSYGLKRKLSYTATDDTIFAFVDSSKTIKKTRLKTTFIQVPVLLETNLGKSSRKSFHLAAGMLFGYRIGSKIKQVYSQDGRDYKIKDKDDLNISPFRASLTARIGYGSFTMFANYSLTPLFEKGAGPELYPFSIGVSILSF